MRIVCVENLLHVAIMASLKASKGARYFWIPYHDYVYEFSKQYTVSCGDLVHNILRTYI